MRRFYILFFVLALPAFLAAQGEIANFNTVFKDNYSVGAGLKSNGYKLMYRRGYFINIYSRKFYEVNFTQIKDPREIKFSNPFYLTTQNIYFGKVNACFDLRFGYGRMRIITQKMDKGSVEIRLITTAGAALGFMKPVYYTVWDKTGSYVYDTKFTEDLLLQQIEEMAPFYKGLDELKINPGGYFNLGISFEHSKKDNLISALEVGGTVSAYMLPMQIIYGDRGRQVILNLYIEYYFGQYFPMSLKRKKRFENTEQQ